MAARINKIRHDENTRAKIRAAHLIERLQNYVDGKIDLKPSQVTAGLGLLRKAVPDLTSVDSTVKSENITHVLSDEPMSEAEWAAKYADDGATTH